MINGVAMIERVLRPVPRESQIIVVGEYPAGLEREVLVTREEPAGAGPLAALAAGLAYVSSEVFLLLATDMPFAGDLGMKLVGILEAESADIDAVVAVDRDSHAQPLCAAYRTKAARAALTRIGKIDNGSMKRLLAELRFQNYEENDAWTLSDVDTIANLQEAQIHAREMEGTRMMDEWIAEVKAVLGLDVDVDVELLLNVAKEAAHNVVRPAAPVTTYLLGIAVANGADAQDAAAKIQKLAVARGVMKAE